MELTASTTIDAPVEDVWAAVTNIPDAADRISGITNVEMLSKGPFDVGTRWRETRMMFGKEATEEMWVSEVDAPNRYRVESESRGTHYVTDFLLEPKDGSTLLTWRFGGTATSFGAKLFTPLGWLFRGTMRKLLLKDLADIKASVEGTSR